MISLQHDGAWSSFITVKGGTRGPWNLFVVDHDVIVQPYGHLSPDESDLKCLPLAWFLSCRQDRSDMPKDGAGRAGARLPVPVVGDLDLISASKVHSAPAFIIEPKFQMEMKIHEVDVRFQISAGLVVE